MKTNPHAFALDFYVLFMAAFLLYLLFSQPWPDALFTHVDPNIGFLPLLLLTATIQAFHEKVFTILLRYFPEKKFASVRAKLVIYTFTYFSFITMSIFFTLAMGRVFMPYHAKLYAPIFALVVIIGITIWSYKEIAKKYK